MSELIEDLEVVQLDSNIEYSANCEEYASVFLSDNYIALPNFKQKIMLFNRKTGKYISSIGDIGNGHGEYRRISYVYISETSGVVFAVADRCKINKYGLDGKFQETLPLAKELEANSNIVVNINEKDKEITIFSGFRTKRMLWKQDFMGNELANIYADDNQDENFGIRMNRCAGEISVSLSNLKNNPDSLYKLNNNALKPVFALNVSHLNENKEYEGTAHARSYFETPKYYITEITELKMKSKNGKIVGASINLLPGGVIVNKENLTGGYFKLFNDYLGLDVTKNVSYADGIFITGYDDAATLVEELESIPEEQKANMNSATRERIDNLISSLDEEGNAVVMIGKLK
ncbi:MAG: 6-bladed beta-propeller [Rikenellaceae bacterium]